MPNKPLTVVGGYAVGFVFQGARLPNPGETVIGNRFYECSGGKGSNQAVTARRLGAPVRLVARLGKDRYGDQALAMYERLGIDTNFIVRDQESHTGVGAILVDSAGRNLISVVPGANLRIAREDIDRAEAAIADSCLVGCQLENNLDAVDYALHKAHRLGVPTLLDPAPAVKLPEDLYPCLDFIKPNETEATILTGINVADPDGAAEAGLWFVQRGVKAAIVTLGQNGAVLVAGREVKHFPAPTVQAVDTTGAGDIFSGALMAALWAGDPVPASIEFASHAAALSVTRPGVIEAIPQRREVLESLAAGRNK